MTSVRFVLTTGVAIFVILIGGLVGGLSIWGGVKSAIELTRAMQHQQTEMLAEEVNLFAQNIEQDIDTMTEVLRRSAKDLQNRPVISALKPFVKNKEHLSSITVVRKNRTNVWVVVWQGEITSEINTDLDAESYDYAIDGIPGDGSEGFDDIYLEPTDKRPVISYTKHFLGCCGDGKDGTLYLDLGLTTLSSLLS